MREVSKENRNFRWTWRTIAIDSVVLIFENQKGIMTLRRENSIVG